MGHSCSVDIQEIVTGAIAGSADYCRPESSLPGPVPDIWVDGARWAGTEDELVKIASIVDERAKSLSATWKDFDKPSTLYDFIGVSFNHDASTVRVADKTRAKIPDECPRLISPRALEQLVGRLLFAAGIAGIPLARHYFAIKWCRRVFNKANRNASWLEPVIVPPSAKALLTSWCKDCVLERKWFEPHGRGEAYLFTDATPTGWGAVIMTPDNRVFATGGHFSENFASINSAETQAVKRGVEAFFPILSSVDVLHLVVDNTSTLANLVSGRAGSAELAQNISNTVDTLQLLKGVSISVSYINSKENPADLPSRGPLTASTLKEIHDRMNQATHSDLSLAWSRVLARMGKTLQLATGS
jgi:hypothetical protein